MHRSKLIDLLKTFNSKELKGLEDFLHSPIHNQSVRCQQLFELIKPYFGDFGHIDLAKENIFFQLFPEKKQFGSSLSVVMAQLAKLAQDFLIFRKFEQNKALQTFLLLDSLNERNLDKHFLRTWKSAKKAEDNLPMKNIGDYYNQYLLTLNKFQYDVGHQKQWSELGIREVLNDLDLFYLIGQLKYYGALANLQRLAPQQSQQKIPIEAINQMIERCEWQRIPLVELHQITLSLTLFPEDSSHFFRLKAFLQSSNARTIFSNDLHDAYSLGLNYCNQKILSGELDYLQEMFELYKGMIQEDLWYKGGYLSHRKLKNVISLGARFEEFQWSKFFLKKHLKYIHPDFRDMAEVFNLGAIYYYQGNFGKAMPYLLQVNNLDAFYATDARVLLLKIYYELGQTIELLDLENSFKIFIKSQRELSKSRKRAYIHFVKFLVALYRIQHKQLKSRKSLETLKKEIETTSPISDKQWLERKIEVL
ncbi:MAG: hypothetical protein ACPGVB_01535 [Chitinophagales bacterium]